MKSKLFCSVLFLLIVLPAFSQDLRINLYTYGEGVDKQLVAVLTNTTDRLIRVHNYEGLTEGSLLNMKFLNKEKKVLYHGIYTFLDPKEYKRKFDIAPKSNISFKYPIGSIRASYKDPEISSVEIFCILKYSTPNTSFSDIYDRTFTFSF